MNLIPKISIIWLNITYSPYIFEHIKLFIPINLEVFDPNLA